ncbi:MAG: RsmG family class I SAM-dependent methyltransferase [Actinomycetota bacterium]
MNRELQAALGRFGISNESETAARAYRLGNWLREEAIPAGGIGPAEGDKIEDRHLVDSLAFATGFPEAPEECWDLGAGVGLPGLMLALVWPLTHMVLIDRSARRCDLARRAARILGIKATIERADIFDLDGRTAAIVSRAAIPAKELVPVLGRLLVPGGRAVFTGSGQISSGRGDAEGGVEIKILDRRRRLLIMQQ